MNTDERLASIEAKLDVLIEANEDKETRMRALERRDAYVLGIAAIFSFIAPIVAKRLFNL